MKWFEDIDWEKLSLLIVSVAALIASVDVLLVTVIKVMK